MPFTNHIRSRVRLVILSCLGYFLLPSGPVFGQTTAQSSESDEAAARAAVQLPEFVLTEDRVANQVPAATFAAPVSDLRFEPRVDLQTRNFAEAQGDVAIRGGIFEGTAVRVGGMTVFDPQTGHYAVELPIPPQMLAAAEIRTGVDHALGAMQATAGTVDYSWGKIQPGGEASAAFGNGDLNRQSIYAAEVIVDDRENDRRVAVDASWSRSVADGTIENGDHDFQRAAGRVQLTTRLGQTEFFGGYQAKFFGWPNLYTPFGVAETENLQTTLLALTHHQQFGESSLEAGVHYRRNRDDYEYDRYRPGIFNPYQHETDVSGGFLHYHTHAGAWGIDVRAEGAADALESTALTFGHFVSRSYWKLGASADRSFDLGSGSLETRVGATFDDTNRDGSAASPVAELAWSPDAQLAGASPRVYAQYSGATRVPGYTALNSNPNGGLFRGNPDLGREKSRNAELGFQLRGQEWSAHAAVFFRSDDPLVDWTYTDTPATRNARRAREVAIDTAGIEILAARSYKAVTVIGGYGWLEKDADYGVAGIDASFYALNFPVHRFTLALIADLGAGFTVRSDNEYRVQEENSLRTVGGNEAMLSSIGLTWAIPRYDAIELALVVDNLWDDDFQEVPAVTAAGRQVTFGATFRW